MAVDPAQVRSAEQIMEKITSAGLTVPLETHAEALTVEAWEPLHKDFAFAAESELTRCLFMKDKKKQLFLLVTLASTRTDLKLFAKTVGAKEPRFAAEDLLNEKLCVVKGAVNPFAIVNDAAKEVTLCVEKALLESEKKLCFHPMDNTKTVALSAAELKQFFTSIGREVTVVDLSADAEASAPAAAPKPKAKKDKPKKEVKKEEPEGNKEGVTEPKNGNFAVWYQQVITKGELIEYYNVKGCYILRPSAMGIWKEISAQFDRQITDMGVQPCYFPIFVTKGALEAEESHVDGFAAEVAWVTKSGQSDLEEPIAVRPTSETVMYPAFKKWIRSYRDLPLRLNQWCNVVRWEFSHPTPFIRTREFLWQEGHTAHVKQEDADQEVLDILNLYAGVYEDLLAVPVVRGTKTEKEKFAGGAYTTTVEAFIPTVGRSVQGATSHCLGTNFGKMFGIQYEDDNKTRQYPIQNSWGMTTRTIGVMIMIHSDDKGLVLPPRVAPVQVVLYGVGINNKRTKEQIARINASCEELEKELKAAGIRAKADMRDTITSGNKNNHWELHGVPMRVEVGLQELDNGKVFTKFRHDASGKTLPREGFAAAVQAELVRVQAEMLSRAREERKDSTVMLRAGEWEKLVPTLNDRKCVIVPFCGDEDCETEIKKRSGDEAQALAEDDEVDERAPSMGAKSLCIPLEQPTEKLCDKCFNPKCAKKPAKWTLFGRSY